MDFEWEELINGESEIDAEDLNLLASGIKQAKTTSEANRTSISRIDDEIESINETLYTQNEKNNEFIKKFSPVIVGRGIGEYINIYDASDAPLLGLRVMGKTKQLKSTGKNMIPFPYNDCKKGTGVVEINGITFTINKDGSILVNGTATADASFYLYRNYDLPSTLPLSVGTYAINSFSTASGMIFQVAFRYNNGEKTIYKQSKSNISITSDMPDASTMSMRIVVYSGRTINNEVVYPMFSSGSAYPDYEPYTNGKHSPSPEYPQDMVDYSHNGGVSISLFGQGDESKSVELPLIEGLAGIGDLSDEIDLLTGIKTTRLKRVVVEELRNVGAIDIADDGRNLYSGTAFFEGIIGDSGMCTIASCSNDAYSDGASGIPSFSTSNGSVNFFIAADSEEDFRSKVIGRELLLQSAEDVVEDGIDTEMFKKLELFKPSTEIIPTGDALIIGNESEPMLSIEYVADTKAYIDNKFAELQAAMLNNI